MPIAIHGDGTPAMGAGKSWSKMIDVWSWGSLLYFGHSEVRRFLIVAIHASLRNAAPGQKTLDVIFQKLKWSLDACYSGFHPKLDWEGKPMTDSRVLLYDSDKYDAWS